jgi:succinate dehydrogenase / fumarate reductase flavoprotein subunit/fumarate reductase (CoM/CoB) subunit A
MWKGAGPLRTEESLTEGMAQLRSLRERAEGIALVKQTYFVLTLAEKIELVNMIKLGESIFTGALARRESRGAHVRLDYDRSYEVPVSTKFQMGSDRQWMMQEIPLPDKLPSRGDE